MNNRCVKFKTKPLEHLELIERMYSGTAATGKHAWTPTELRDDDAAVANVDDDSGIGPLSASIPPHLGHDTVKENVVDSSLFNDTPPYSAVDRLANAKCRKRPTPSIVASSMDNLVEAISKQRGELKITQHVPTGICENTVGNCLVRLMNTPRLEPSGQLFSFTCNIMDSPDNHDLMMALLLDYIIAWLKEKRACTPQNVGRERQRDVRLFGSDGVVNMD
ncbi:uncharacterized protein LOC114295968 [Camellia sinensis]|uniref:uncharacterized protein LOC114295968 n=1 Tax=Camellia sinensis TaxID=4442 RepID=UPI001036CFD9|nr:uncharacterized protein LOC114295968 [Camellia sinensis]